MQQKKIRLAGEADWRHISRISKASGYADYINEIGPAYMSDGTILVCDIDTPCGFLKIEMLPDAFEILLICRQSASPASLIFFCCIL